MSLKTIPITLIEAFMLTAKVKHFIFKLPEIDFKFIPGQFITLQFELDGKILRRSYSLANKDISDNRIEFAAGFVADGPGTNLLFNLKPGDKIDMAGPFGRLILKDETPKRYILVATSTGVTPYRSMIPELTHRISTNPMLKVALLQGVQSRDDLLYDEEFQNFANSSEQVEYYSCFSRKCSIISHHEHIGYVQTLFNQLNLNQEQDIIYLCGNPGMIDESFNYLKDLGFNPQQIIREKYISGK